MEPMIQRMVIHLKTYFDFDVVHLPGKENHLADYLSRPVRVGNAAAVGLLAAITGSQRALTSYMGSDLFLEEFAAVTDGAADSVGEYTVREAFATAHVLHGIHQSPQRTWARLHRFFPW